MSRFTRFALGLLLLCAALRALLFLVGAFFRLQTPLESFNPLEPKLVHLAWRAQHGVQLYPEWRDYPHVANFFGPIYFLVIGMIGRGVGASIEGLYAIGRTVTFTAALLTSLLVAGVLGRRYGRGAAVLGACVSLGAAPLDGFAVMTRPDVLAELLGFSGFLLAAGNRVVCVWVGGIVLALAVMTKQTAGAYVIAGVIALLAQHHARRAFGLALGVGLLLAGAVAVLQLGFEPRFVDNLLGERYSPWSLAGWVRLLARLAMIGPELPLLAIMGIIFWSRGDRHERSWAALAAVQLAVRLVASAKYGADLNYFLGLGIVAALAAGTLWDRAWRSAAPPRLWHAGVGALLSALLMLESGGSLLQIERILRYDVPGYRPSTRRLLLAYRSLFRIASDPSQRLLTDSGMIDIRQGARTVFADPWLFRVLVDVGQVRTAKLEAMIDRQEFSMIVTTHDMFAADYASYDMGLPMALVRRARTQYMPRGSVGDLFLSTPRPPENGGGS